MIRSRMRNISLSVFMPCYNEEANVERTTLAALDALRAFCDDFELIIVNDGSTDQTGTIAERLAAEHPEVRVVHNPVNRGYGGALRAGFAATRKEWVFYTDGDGQFDCREIFKLLPALNHFDLVSAYRLDRKDSWVRRFNGRAWTWLCNLILGLRLRDVDCAFKLLPRRLLEQIELRSEGALIDAELLGKAAGLGYRIGQVGVHHYPRLAGSPTGGRLRVITKAFWELVKLRRVIRAATPPPGPGVGKSKVVC